MFDAECEMMCNTRMNDDASKVYDNMEDANEFMYSGCKFTKLSIKVRLFHIKCLNKVTDKALFATGPFERDST